jgi:hypothetical protein
MNTISGTSGLVVSHYPMNIENIEQTQRKIYERIYEYPEEPIYPWQHVEDPKHAIILHRNETERRKYCN